MELKKAACSCTIKHQGRIHHQMHVAKEALWLCSFLWELCSAPDDPLILNCDNQGVIALAKDNKFHAHTKHIDMHYHFIHEVVEDGKVVVQ